MRASKLFEEFFHSEKASGIVLICCTAISIALANSPWHDGYVEIWHYKVFAHSLAHWINDGLMAIFFLLIGLELEREVYIGELSNFKNALLPIVAAVGGMLVPASLHFVFNYGTPTQSGSGIPMATDIAFALAVLSLLGNRIPTALKVFLTALAVIDDLGAILVIAIFYTGSIDWAYLGGAIGIFVSLLVLNRVGIRNLVPYLIGGIGMWYLMLHSGIHATIAGVLLAFAIPFGNGDEKSTSYVLQKALHVPVAFIVIPLFALANTAVRIPNDWIHAMVELNNIGIFAGLVVGKPVGIFIFSFVPSKIKITRLPDQVTWSHILGAGMLGGIGFTMSIFITLLAFKDERVIDLSKLVILFSSVLSGIMGYLYLRVKDKTAMHLSKN